MNSTRQLTDSVAAECVPSAREYAVHDTALRGFALRVQPSGAKTWVLRCTHEGQPHRVSIGDARLLSATTARARAHALLAQGEFAKKPTTAAGLRFAEYAELYCERRKPHWKSSALPRVESKIRSMVLPTFGEKPIASITRADVARWFHEYSATYPGGANRTLEIVKSMFYCARDWGILPENHVNPCKGIKRNRRPPRGRLINRESLNKLGVALDRLSVVLADQVDAIRLLLYTGCRSGEILGLTWEEAKPDRLLLRDAKTGPRTVMLGDPARRILARRQETASAYFVFPAPRDPKRPRSEIRSAWIRIRREAGLADDIRLHDLRHTFASHAVMGGETLLITSTLLGHRQTITTARYAHLQDTHLLAAATRIAGRISGWMNGRAESVPMGDNSNEPFEPVEVGLLFPLRDVWSTRKGHAENVRTDRDLIEPIEPVEHGRLISREQWRAWDAARDKNLEQQAQGTHKGPQRR